MGFLSGVGDALERMRRMMVKTDVDLSQLPGEEIAQTMREAGKACCGCGATGECDKFLDETPDHVKAPEFCPNATRFAPFVDHNAA